MSNSTCNIRAFRQTAKELDIFMPEYWLEQNPFRVVSQLLERIKFGAKILARTSGMKQSTALGHIAIAVGFPHWHALNAHLVAIASSPPKSVDRVSISRLTQALVFLIKTDSQTSVSTDQQAAYEIFGTKLAASAGLPLEKVMDTVCAGYCKEATWAKVKERSPLNSTIALHKFEVDEWLGGRFIRSAACEELVSTLDEVNQDADTPGSVLKARLWLEKAIERQPAFFEGGLCLANMYYEMGDLNTAARIINENIQQAELLIPKGYRGKIIWGRFENRAYHRMLTLRMTINHDAGRIRDSLRDARKQLRLNPNDNLGVRYVYPLMLLEIGEYGKAAKAARFSDEDGYDAALIRSFTKFAIGDYSGFIQEFIAALFDLPIIRVMLLDSIELPGGDNGYRSMIPDMDSLAEYIFRVYHSVPGLEEACVRLLSNQSVIGAETQLRNYWFLRKAKQNAESSSIEEQLSDADGWMGLRAKLSATIPLIVAEEFSYLSR